jgi:hypothetical protein
MYFLAYPNKENFSKEIIGIEELENFIKDIKENKKMKEMEETSLNKIFYFLLGHHGKILNCNKGFLPTKYIKNINMKDLEKDNQLPSLIENSYDISNYEGLDNNQETINNAFNSLPITNNMTNQFISGNFLLCAINKDIILMLMFNIIGYDNIQSNVEEKYSKYIINLQVGKNIFNNLYLTLICELLLPNLYKYNKYCDFALGAGLIIDILPLLINLNIIFDIYNNTINFKLSLNWLINIGGENNYYNQAPPFLEYI